jgi:hypothetical protein
MLIISIVLKVTNEDRMRLHHNLVNCRRALIDCGQLKKPGDEAGGGGANFFKNTLRRLSVRKMEKYRAEALANEQVKLFLILMSFVIFKYLWTYFGSLYFHIIYGL